MLGHERLDLGEVGAQVEAVGLGVDQRPGSHAEPVDAAMDLARPVLGVDVQHAPGGAADPRDRGTVADRGGKREREHALALALAAGDHRDVAADEQRLGGGLGAGHLRHVQHAHRRRPLRRRTSG
jgi:hypothetical protein